MAEPTAIFSLRYAGSVGYYAAMLRYGSIVLDIEERFCKKNKCLNRMDIVGPNGRQSLSMPLAKPNSSQKVGEIVLSEHGNWRHNHWGALFSAYGRTPFFEYFADDLKQLYQSDITTVGEFNLELHRLIVDFLDLPIETKVADGSMSFDILHDFRDRRQIDFCEYSLPSYYQIWSDKQGFIPNLSILDLLFNEGRQAIYHFVGHK